MLIYPVIVTRLDSSRIPGKCLLPLLNGRSPLGIIFDLIYEFKENPLYASFLSDAIIATTSRKCDDSLEYLASSYEPVFFRDDVSPLRRFINLAQHLSCDGWLWRINTDSPFIMRELIAKGIELAQSEKNTNISCITNLRKRSFPYGVSLEMYKISRLLELRIDYGIIANHENIARIQDLLDLGEIRDVISEHLGLPPFDPTLRLTLDYPEDIFLYNLNLRRICCADLNSSKAISALSSKLSKI